MYYFENTQTGELRLYGTPGLIRAQSVHNDADAAGGQSELRQMGSDHIELVGVSEERRALGGDPSLLAMERCGFYKISLFIWLHRTDRECLQIERVSR